MFVGIFCFVIGLAPNKIVVFSAVHCEEPSLMTQFVSLWQNELFIAEAKTTMNQWTVSKLGLFWPKKAFWGQKKAAKWHKWFKFGTVCQFMARQNCHLATTSLPCTFVGFLVHWFIGQQTIIVVSGQKVWTGSCDTLAKTSQTHPNRCENRCWQLLDYVFSNHGCWRAP